MSLIGPMLPSVLDLFIINLITREIPVLFKTNNLANSLIEYLAYLSNIISTIYTRLHRNLCVCVCGALAPLYIFIYFTRYLYSFVVFYFWYLRFNN